MSSCSRQEQTTSSCQSKSKNLSVNSVMCHICSINEFDVIVCGMIMWNIYICLFNLIADFVPKEKMASQSNFWLGTFFIVLLIQDSKKKKKLHSSLSPPLIKTSNRFGKIHHHLKYMFSAWWLPNPYRHSFFLGGNFVKFIFNWRIIASDVVLVSAIQ